ncbi:hypothetical protein [Herbaspirillum lusitanum]|uniref:hypothetical protein n=1 Tax=Herbaspirillum lusitanum TaxID=213312 RepID=UPI0012F49D7E|nr:hypothetical protein [Herbaspirillum lusitanum]
MKSLAHSSIGSRAATLLSAAPGFAIACFICAAAVLAVAFCTIFFPAFPSFAAPFAQAGIAVSIAARNSSQQHIATTPSSGSHQDQAARLSMFFHGPAR